MAYSTSGEGSTDQTLRLGMLNQMNQHLFTPGLVLKIHAFTGAELAWDDSSPEIEFRRIP